MAIGIACFAVFLIMAALMYSRKISALLALPLMAIAIAIVGQIPADRILTDVLAKGSVKLANAYTTTIFGAILAELINKLGIAKALVRWVAEFGGDNPFLLGLFMTLVTGLLFTSLGGLGAVIMVGTVVLPVMSSLGISPVTAGSLFLFGINIGGLFNLANWQLYIDVLHLDRSVISSFVVPLSMVVGCLVLVFLAIELRRWKNIKYLLGGVIVMAAGFGLLAGLQKKELAHAAVSNAPAVITVEPLSVQVMSATFVLLVIYALYRNYRRSVNLPAVAFLTPVIPLALVLVGHWDIIPAFIAGMGFAVLSTWQRGSVSTLTRSIIEGSGTVAPAVVVMLGIGMLLAAVTDPAVKHAIAPLLVAVVPTHALPFVLVFTILAPLALYRGPLSLWGMGSGLVTLMIESTALSAKAIMSMLLSVGQVQGVSDPTNTQNVWVATYLGIDTQALLRRTLPYSWLAALIGLVMAAMKHWVQ